MSEPQVAFRDIPADSFPFHYEIYDKDTGTVYVSETIHGPGALRIPPKPEHVREAGVRVRFANGMEFDL